MRVKHLFLAMVAGAAVSAVAATSALAPLDNKPEMQTVRDPVQPDPELLAEYRVCSDLAEEYVLSADYARHCSNVYLALKLSFLPDVDLAVYSELSMEERLTAQKSGYAAYRQWTEANMSIVQSDESGT